MNRTLCILVWTIVTYYTSLNMEQFGFGNLTQVIGLFVGSALSACVIAAFVATEREILKFGMLASVISVAVAAMQEPTTYFTFYYNIDKSVPVHTCLALLVVGTVGAIRCARLYCESLKLEIKVPSAMQVMRNLFADEA